MSAHAPACRFTYLTVATLGICLSALAADPKPQPAMPAELKMAYEDARYAIEKGLRAENDANGFSIQFSGAETTLDTGSARATLTLQRYGWGSALRSAGPVTQMEPKGKRLERHYGTALTEWFLNTPQGLEQGFVIAHRAKRADGALQLRLTASGGWNVDGSGDGVRLMKGGVTLDYAGLKAWDAMGAVIPSRLRGSGTSIEIEVADAGAVYPLSIDPTFTQQQKLTASDAAANDFFGYSVALSGDGNTALVGASSKNSVQGAAYVFTRLGASWTQQQELTVSDEAINDAFGVSVGLSSDGNTALVGADQESSGAAYVFTHSGATWTQQQKLTASDAANHGHFGVSVGLSNDGNTVLVGAAGKNFSQGAAYVFTRSGAAWTQQQELDASDAAVGDFFGYSVGLSSDGNTALVGAFGKDPSGAAYVFTRSGAAWTQQQELTASDAAVFDYFGVSVGLSSDGNTALVGAYGKNPGGAAYVFTRSGATWTQEQELTAYDAANYDEFGYSVGLSSDGNTALVGAAGKNSYQGAAYVFTRSGAAWSQQQKMTASDAAASDWFGHSVGLSSDGNTMLVGAYGKNSYQGAAYVYALITSTCSSTLNLGGQGFPPQGGSGAVNITTSPGCPWTVDSIPARITLTSPALGTGSGTVTFTVIANSGGDLFKSFVIAGQTFTIEQEAASIPGLNFIGSMPHLAAEENWTTALTLVNKSGVSATARLSLLGDGNSYSLYPNGSGPLTLPLAFPQQPPAPGPLLAASFDRTLSPNASIIVATAGAQSPPVLIGSAQLAATSAVDGFAIFHQIVTTQEAVVPLETRNARSYLLPFDNTSNLVLGVALANISTQAVDVQVVIRDDAGTLMTLPPDQQSVHVAAGDHFQFGLTAQFPATVNMRGTIEFDTPQNDQISVLGLRFTPPNNALTTIRTLANVGTGGGSFAHLASGDGWQTTFVLVNTGTSAAQFTLSFYADQTGLPQQLPLSFPQPDGGTDTMATSGTQMLPAGATRLIVSSGAPQLITGSAQLSTTGNVSGFVIFRHNNQEAVVPLESRNAGSYILAFDNTGGTATGIAVNAVSAGQVNIPVTVRDTTGSTIATDTITLSANGHTQFTLVTDKYPMTASIRGTIEFGTPAGSQIGALGIRIPDVPAHTYTTLPALAK
jgi:FG-GAP repeat